MITYDRPMNVDIDQCRDTRILFLTIALSVALPCLAQTPEAFEVRRAEAAFEELPVLNASEILRPEFLSGPYHKVREPVPTYFGANQFTIDSDFGVFEANGNEMLVTRIKEINAIARLNPSIASAFRLVASSAIALWNSASGNSGFNLIAAS